jgi:seryl-tRNA synthetase (EC 6.1.1.11)
LTFFFSAKTSTPPSRAWKPAKKPQAFLNVEAFQGLESERKTLQTRTEELQAQRNQLSKQVGMLMSRGDKDGAEAVKAQVAAGKVELEQSLHAWNRSSPSCRPCWWPCPTCRTNPCPWAGRGWQCGSAPLEC